MALPSHVMRIFGPTALNRLEFFGLQQHSDFLDTLYFSLSLSSCEVIMMM